MDRFLSSLGLSAGREHLRLNSKQRSPAEIQQISR
jgi:hypothetical protein